eukprot:g5436.t1
MSFMHCALQYTLKDNLDTSRYEPHTTRIYTSRHTIYDTHHAYTSYKERDKCCTRLCSDVPVRGTTKFYAQVCDKPHRYQILTTMAERPWRPLFTFYAYGAPNGYNELRTQKDPIREGVLGGTAKAAYRERRKAQDLVNKVEREFKLMDRLRKEAKAAQRSNINQSKKMRGMGK